MLKFLRKYDKWILAIGGSLLMVVFLLPQALTQWGTGGGERVVAVYDYGEITAQDRFDANRDVRFLEGVFGPVMTSLGISDPDHWIMLEEEARRSGYVGGPSSGRDLFDQIAAAQGAEDVDRAFVAVLAATGVAESTALEALATLSGVARMRRVYLQTQRLSTPELLSAYRRTVETVGLHAALVPAEAMLPAVPESPPEDALRAFYDEHKDVPRGGGALEFGYRVDPAVKLEWIEISQSEIERLIPVDPVDVNARWRRNRELYPGEFSEERQGVEADMRRQAAVSIMSDINTLIQAEVARAARDDETVDLRSLGRDVSLRLSEREGWRIPPLVYSQRDEWTTLSQLRAVARLRNARPISGRASDSFPQIAMNVAELNPEDPHDVSVGDVVGPLQSDAGSRIYARVAEARPAGPPETFDMVREQVVEDYRLQQAWDRLQERAERFPAQIAARNLATVASDAGGEIVAGIRATPERLSPPVTREIDQQVFGRLNRREFASVVVEQAQRFEPIGDVRDLPIEDRLVIVDLPDQAAVAIGEIISVDPITQTAFVLNKPDTIVRVQDQRFRMMSMADPFSLEAMKARLQYESVGDREDELAPELDPEPAETGDDALAEG